MTNVIKIGKKTFTWSVVLMTILWSIGAAALVPLVANAAEPVAGDYIKTADSSTVYLLVEEGGVLKTVYIPHSNVITSWEGGGYSSQVKTVASFPYAAATNPDGLNQLPGSVLIKRVEQPDVYAVLAGNKRAKLASAEVAAALYGDMWYTNVVDIHAFHWGNYTDVDDITSAVPHDGMLVSQDGNNYLVVDGEYQMVDGTLPSHVSAHAVSATVFAELAVSDTTATAASVTADPGQRGSSTSSGTTTPPADAGDLSISLAADTPASGYVYKNSTHNAFTKVKLTNTSGVAVTVDSFVVQRAGAPASDAAFTGVNVLQEDGTLLNSSYKTLNSDHQATFTNDVVVPANSSVYLTLLGKMVNNTTYSGEVPRLAMVSVETDASVTASFPLQGNAMTFNTTVTVGVATVSESPNLGTLTEEVGTSDVELLNVKIVNDSGTGIDLQVDSIRFNNAGSADDADVDDLALVVDGEVVAESTMVNNYVYFDLSSVAKAKIDNGKNETFSLRGTIAGGSGRTLDFDIKKADDIFAFDLLNGAYVTPSAAIDSGRTITVSRGTLNVSKTNTVQAQNIPKNTTDLKFGSWNFKVQGESITIASLAFRFNVNGTVQAADMTQMKLVNSAGKALTGTFSGVGAGDGTATTTDSFTLPEGDNELTLVGKLNNDGAAGDWIEVSIDFSYEAGLDATGNTTGDAITIETSTAYAFPNARITANRQTLSAGSLSVTTLSSPPAETLAGGVSGHHFATVALNGTASSENVKITTFSFNVTTTAAETNQIQNITFMVNDTADGSYRTLTTTKNGSSATAGNDELISVTLPSADQIIVPKGKTVNLKIYADISAGTSANDLFQVFISNAANDQSETSTVTAEGTLTGGTVSATYSSASGQVMTVGTAGGQLEVALASDNASAALMAANTDVELASFRFLATTTEDVAVDYLYLTQLVTVSASSSFKDYDYIWFEDADGNEVAGTRMSPTSTKPYIDFTDGAFVVEADGSSEVLYLMANLAPIGSCASLTCTGQNGVPSHRLGYKINAAATDVVALGNDSGSGTTEYAGTVAPTGNTHYVFKSYPVVSKKSVASSKLANGTRDLFTFQVSAVNGDIGLGGFTFDIATTTASVVLASCYLYDTTDSAEKKVNNIGACAGAATGSDGLVDSWYTTGLVTQLIAHEDDWTEYNNDTIVVSPVKPRTFVFRANITGATTGAAVSVGLAGDSGATVQGVGGGSTNMLSAANADNLVHDDFIWSDLSDNGHTKSTTDWTNGFLVKGLSSSTSTLETVAF
jgi:hypothetical protein